MQTETFQALPNIPTHGYSGPLKVSYGGAVSNIGNDFLNVAAEYDKQRKFTEDPNGMHTCDAYGVDIFVNFCRDTTTDSSYHSALAKVRTYYGT